MRYTYGSYSFLVIVFRPTLERGTVGVKLDETGEHREVLPERLEAVC